MWKAQSFSMPSSQRPEKYAIWMSSAAPMSCAPAPLTPSSNGPIVPTCSTQVETTITVNYQLGDPADSQSQNNESAAEVVPKKIGGGVSAPVLIYSVSPEFSEQAKQDKVGGIVLVHPWVDERGRPGHVSVLLGVGNGLDEKAVEAVKQYKFNPAMEGGKPFLVELNTEV